MMDRRAITIRRFPVGLRLQVKLMAQDTGMTVGSLFERIVREWFDSRSTAKEASREELRRHD